MGLVSWIVLGLIAGFVGSKVVNRQGSGVFMDIVLGIVGAVVGGWLFHHLGYSGVNGLNLWSFFVASVGAAVTLSVGHVVRRIL